MSDQPLSPLPSLDAAGFDPLAEALTLAGTGVRITERLTTRGQPPRERSYATRRGPGSVFRIPLPGVEGAITYFIERASDAWLLMSDPADVDVPTPFAKRTARRFPASLFGLRQIEQVVLAETR